MITVLIPLDYSKASRNVLEYIAAASNDIEINRVILLKSNYYSVYQNMLHSAEYVFLNQNNFETEREEAAAFMNEINKDFLQRVSANTKVENAFTEIPLENAINEIAERESPDLLVLSSSRKPDDGNFIARNAISIAKSSSIPVMIVPENTTYQTIDTAVVPIDFRALSRLEAFHEPIFAATNRKPYLQVLNIHTGKDDIGQPQAQQALHRILDGYDFSMHHVDDKDVVHGVMSYIRANNIRLIIALPGKYNFFKALTHRSITQAIAADATIPVLILRSNG